MYVYSVKMKDGEMLPAIVKDTFVLQKGHNMRTAIKIICNSETY
jgi:hypothetical protein